MLKKMSASPKILKDVITKNSRTLNLSLLLDNNQANVHNSHKMCCLFVVMWHKVFI